MNYTKFEYFCKAFPNVSRETIGKIDMFLTILKKWNSTHNLLQGRTLDDCELELRHLIDCWQLISYIPADAKILDVGSGNGFPGVLLAIADFPVTMIERDKKKFAFLKYCLSELDLPSEVKCVDAHFVADAYSVVVSRAFTSLLNLLRIQKNVSRETMETIGLFLKGAHHIQEIEEAKKEWNFDYMCYDSLSSGDSGIIMTSNVVRKI